MDRNEHSVEKIGGVSMSNYVAVRDNIVWGGGERQSPYQRIFVVSAYGGVTNELLEHKKSGRSGVYALFAGSTEEGDWLQAFSALRHKLHDINRGLFRDKEALEASCTFIDERLDAAAACLTDLQRLCRHGHFALEQHLDTVREMLASIGEAHSAWNTSRLLQADGVNARFIDLSGWRTDGHVSLDERIENAFADVDLANELPIVTGYAHCEKGLMASFDRGYSEMTFSRIAVLTRAREAVIHKEFHLSSADPRIVGEQNVVPIGRTNYDVADQLANLGMEAIHPKAAKGLRQNNIPLRVKNTFEPEHNGTLITGDYLSDKPCVEIITGCKGVYALELFDQDMPGDISRYDREILAVLSRFRVQIVAKDINANTITHFVYANLKTVKRVRRVLEATYPDAEVNQRQVAIVSAVGSDMEVPGILARAVTALAEKNINVLAMHQSMRQVDMQFVVNDEDYEPAIRSLHRSLVEIHGHGSAICAA